MSTPDFNEADHPRAAGGRFATKNHAEADVSLTESTEGTGPIGQLRHAVDEGFVSRWAQAGMDADSLRAALADRTDPPGKTKGPTFAFHDTSVTHVSLYEDIADDYAVWIAGARERETELSCADAQQRQKANTLISAGLDPAELADADYDAASGTFTDGDIGVGVDEHGWVRGWQVGTSIRMDSSITLAGDTSTQGERNAETITALRQAAAERAIAEHWNHSPQVKTLAKRLGVPVNVCPALSQNAVDGCVSFRLEHPDGARDVYVDVEDGQVSMGTYSRRELALVTDDSNVAKLRPYEAQMSRIAAQMLEATSQSAPFAPTAQMTRGKAKRAAATAQARQRAASANERA